MFERDLMRLKELRIQERQLSDTLTAALNNAGITKVNIGKYTATLHQRTSDKQFYISFRENKSENK